MASKNVFKLISIDNKLFVEASKEEIVSENVVIEDKNREFSIQSKQYSEIDSFIDYFDQQLCSLNTTEVVKDTVYKLCENLVTNCEKFYSTLIKEKCEANCVRVLSEGAKYVAQKLKKRDSKQKRMAIIKKKDNYVPPSENTIGMQWKTIVSTDIGIPDYQLIHSTYHIISIEQSLRSFFMNTNFSNMYKTYNESPSHNCATGCYVDFCCGEIYKQIPVFQESKYTIQLQISFDEFEPCDPIKSKSGLHKMLGVYMEIRNVPEFYRSKMDNMFLVALIKSNDIKEKNESIDIVYAKIVDELNWLAANGMDGVFIDSSRNLKAALINISADNLGANDVFGFVKSFRAQYFCRICSYNQDECKLSVRENPLKIRNMSDYNQLIEKADQRNGRYIESKGIVKYCAFNDLNHFNIFQNFSVDVMHDIFEGIIPFFVNMFLNHMIEKKIATFTLIQKKIRDYCYGYLWKPYKPSPIKLECHLGQNAMQNNCLMIHLPFIFIEFKPKMIEIWKSMQDLLQIMQIVTSKSIRDKDLDRLAHCIEEHLSFIIEKTDSKLICKHHIITHYPTLIKKHGPIIHMWMMRFESMHKIFTDKMRQTKNFINITKTLAEYYQSCVCLKNKTCERDVKKSAKSYDVEKNESFNEYANDINCLKQNGKIIALNFLYYESFDYRKGLMVIEKKEVFEILHVIEKETQFFAFCRLYNLVKFNNALNSIQVEKNVNSYRILNIAELKNKKTYEKKFVGSDTYIIANTLDVFNDF